MTDNRIRAVLAAAGGASLWTLAPALASESAEKPSLFTGDLGNIIWSLLTFVVVLVVLRKFAWKPILGSLQKREEFIRDSLAEAKRNRIESEARLKEYTEKVTKARIEASAIVEEGRRDAESIKHQIEETAKSEAAAMIDRARREISIATETAVKQLYSVSAQLATLTASRILKKELDAKQHETLVRESIDELNKSFARSSGEGKLVGRG